MTAFVKKHPDVKVGTVEATAKFGKLIVLATAGGVCLEALEAAGHANLKDKTIIDVTNPIDANDTPVDGVLPFTVLPAGSQLDLPRILSRRSTQSAPRLW